jgi:stearoyl-CoA desaturase (delta-9 desaturase)
MNLTTNQEQILKFCLILLFSIVGCYLFFKDNGSLVELFLLYIFFAVIALISNIGYHRWLAHNHFTPNKIIKFFLLWTITASALIKPLPYVVGHRLHHKYSDTDKDPHHTRLGFWNFLIGNYNTVTNVSIPVKDILRDKDIMFVNKYYYYLYFLNLFIFYLIDYHLFLLSFLLLNLRFWISVAVFNYLAHGGKEIQSPQNLPTWTTYVFWRYGEQLHKNHHDDPSSSNFGKTSKYNFDVIYYIIKFFTKVKN